MTAGWIKLHRQVMDSPFCRRSAERLGFWVLLLLKANHSEETFFIGHSRVTCGPGQFATGRKQLAQEAGVSESSVERWLKDLENEQQIEQQTFNKFRLVKLKNWERYQNLTQQQNNNRTTTEQQLNTNKKDKNEKNEKKDDTAEMIKWFRRNDVGNPEAYLTSLRKKVRPDSIARAWKDAYRGVGIGSPGEFWTRCLHYDKEAS